MNEYLHFRLCLIMFSKNTPENMVIYKTVKPLNSEIVILISKYNLILY